MGTPGPIGRASVRRAHSTSTVSAFPARSFARERHEQLNVTCNSEIPLDRLVRLCALDGTTESLLARAANKYGLSARTVHRVLRIARTVADLDGSDVITKDHVLESLTYRMAGTNVAA